MTKKRPDRDTSEQILLLIEVRRDTYLAWAFLLFVLFGFYQLLTGNYLGERNHRRTS